MRRECLCWWWAINDGNEGWVGVGGCGGCCWQRQKKHKQKTKRDFLNFFFLKKYPPIDTFCVKMGIKKTLYGAKQFVHQLNNILVSIWYLRGGVLEVLFWRMMKWWVIIILSSSTTTPLKPPKKNISWCLTFCYYYFNVKTVC